MMNLIYLLLPVFILVPKSCKKNDGSVTYLCDFVRNFLKPLKLLIWFITHMFKQSKKQDSKSLAFQIQVQSNRKTKLQKSCFPDTGAIQKKHDLPKSAIQQKLWAPCGLLLRWSFVALNRWLALLCMHRQCVNLCCVGASLRWRSRAQWSPGRSWEPTSEFARFPTWLGLSWTWASLDLGPSWT